MCIGPDFCWRCVGCVAKVIRGISTGLCLVEPSFSKFLVGSVFLHYELFYYEPWCLELCHGTGRLAAYEWPHQIISLGGMLQVG